MFLSSWQPRGRSISARAAGCRSRSNANGGEQFRGGSTLLVRVEDVVLPFHGRMARVAAV
jgi:hypothetical protein